ncbi:MAG: hypothetical protein IJA65_00115 [Acholeplasmatales bacterium]|nr:hypothetical protein [Acholeplasmatales bacterium]
MRRLIIKIVISLILIIATILVVYYFKQNKQTDDLKEITIIVVNKNEEEIINDTYEVKKESLFDILDENYEIRYKEDIYGKVLYDIENIKTDFYTSYIAIYINDEYSNLGISSIILKDNMVITLKETII